MPPDRRRTAVLPYLSSGIFPLRFFSCHDAILDLYHFFGESRSESQCNFLPPNQDMLWAAFIKKLLHLPVFWPWVSTDAS